MTQGTAVTTTDYLGGYQYVNNTLQFFPTAEGYAQPSGTAYSYVYQYKDHLGNVRLSYSDANNDKLITNNEIVEESHYYPFGLKQTGYNNVITSTNAGQKYKFLGQERQDELGLNWDTFRYRNYDTAIGRFMGVDPITEEYMSISPYQFAHNNPVWKIELEGLEGKATSGNDVVNREPVYMSTNIIINTTNIQSSKPQNSRPGVPMLRMGIGVEGSQSRSTGGEFAQANGTATAYQANVGLAVCVDGERVEYGVTVGQVNGDASVGGQNVANGQFTTFSAEGSYNMRNGDQQLNMQTFTGDINVGNGENGGDNTQSDLMADVKALGAYIEVNLTEAGNNLQDFGNLIMSYLQGVTEDYFNQNNTSGVSVNPVR